MFLSSVQALLEYSLGGGCSSWLVRTFLFPTIFVTTWFVFAPLEISRFFNPELLLFRHYLFYFLLFTPLWVFSPGIDSAIFTNRSSASEETDTSGNPIRCDGGALDGVHDV